MKRVIFLSFCGILWMQYAFSQSSTPFRLSSLDQFESREKDWDMVYLDDTKLFYRQLDQIAPFFEYWHT
jgi:hypothetical protein